MFRTKNCATSWLFRPDKRKSAAVSYHGCKLPNFGGKSFVDWGKAERGGTTIKPAAPQSTISPWRKQSTCCRETNQSWLYKWPWSLFSSFFITSYWWPIDEAPAWLPACLPGCLPAWLPGCLAACGAELAGLQAGWWGGGWVELTAVSPRTR